MSDEEVHAKAADAFSPEDPPSILLVDNEPKVIEVAANLLRQEGYLVDAAQTLPQALKALAARTYDLLLVELDLADMCLLGEVKRRSPSTISVVLTGCASLESAVAALRHGAHDYLVKPCVVEDLKQTIRRAITQRRATLLAIQREHQLQELNDQLEERVRRRTAELAEVNQHLAEMNSAKDHFLATLSHELRTPLTPLRAALDLLKLRGDPGLQSVLESMERSLVQETRLIDDLLDMARITAGKLDIQQQATDVSICLQAAIDTVQPKIQSKNQTVTLKLQENFPLMLADPVRLQQVVCNLLDNASKFSPVKGRILVEARQKDDRLLVSVTDIGPGIDPAFLSHVFKPFRQADSSSRRQYGGLGLGLTIARQIIELHHGTMWVENVSPGPGARFTFSIPMIPAPPPAPITAPADLGKLRLLLVDDSIDTIQVLSRLLEAKGMDVTAAGNVRQALASIQAHPPDVIITDIGMPGEDGYDLLRRLRAEEKLRHIPVVAATGYVGNTEEARMAAMGFAASLSKPFNIEELLHILQRVGQKS